MKLKGQARIDKIFANRRGRSRAFATALNYTPIWYKTAKELSCRNVNAARGLLSNASNRCQGKTGKRFIGRVAERLS